MENLPERAAVDENESQNCCFVRRRLSSSDLFWSEEKAPPVDVSNAQLEYLLEIGVTFAPKTETGR